MKRNTMYSLTLFFSLSLSPSAYGQDDCSAILQNSAANVTYLTSQEESAASQAQYLCSELYQNSSSSSQQGFEAAYKVFSASYSTGTSTLSEFRSKYCSAGQQSFFKKKDVTSYARTIVESSVQAWTDCVALSKKDVLISPVRSADGRGLVASLKYTGIGTASLTGVIVTPAGAFTCKDQDGAALTESVRKPLGTAKWSFNCTRTVRVGPDGAVTAPAASITLTTNVADPYQLHFPQLATPDLRSANAQALRAEIAELRSELRNALPAPTDGSSTSGCVVLVPKTVQVCWGSAELAPHDHTRSFAFSFRRPFREAPTVIPGINTHSAGDTGAVYSFEIDSTRYVGAINNMLNSGQFLPGKVLMSYVAIGVPGS